MYITHWFFEILPYPYHNLELHFVGLCQQWSGYAKIVERSGLHQKHSYRLVQPEAQTDSLCISLIYLCVYELTHLVFCIVNVHTCLYYWRCLLARAMISCHSRGAKSWLLFGSWRFQIGCIIAMV